VLKPQTLEQQRFDFPCPQEVDMEHDLRTFSGLMTQSNALMETETMSLIVNPHAQAYRLLLLYSIRGKGR